MDEQRQDDQLEPIYNSFVPIRDVAQKTSRKRRTIEMDDERGSGRSVLAAHDDDDIYDKNQWNIDKSDTFNCFRSKISFFIYRISSETILIILSDSPNQPFHHSYIYIYIYIITYRFYIMVCVFISSRKTIFFINIIDSRFFRRWISKFVI